MPGIGKMKSFGLKLVFFLSIVWRIIPRFFRIQFMTGLCLLESRYSDPKNGLEKLFLIRDRLDWIINERAMVYGDGEHPKHRLTQYHKFFIQRIRNGEAVLDVGCGYGAVARSIACAHPSSKVVGIDKDQIRLSVARANDNPPNLSFIDGDATKIESFGLWNVVVLSNVLEHIVDRVGFLKSLKSSTGASRFLIRVPLFERDWQIALRKELRINFFSDDDHKTEHTLAEFLLEIDSAGLFTLETITLWGEIWANCESKYPNANL